MSDIYQDERLCDHCGTDTEHRCQDSAHERDSSSDWEECQRCGYHRVGGGSQSPPSQERLLEILASQLQRRFDQLIGHATVNDSTLQVIAAGVREVLGTYALPTALEAGVLRCYGLTIPEHIADDTLVQIHGLEGVHQHPQDPTRLICRLQATEVRPLGPFDINFTIGADDVADDTP